MTLRAPFIYFGGKSRIASRVWRAFGDIVNYVEPFAGSLAVLLARPDGWTGIETVNDADGFICNFWRAVTADPDAVAGFADWPVNENDLHARHSWLIGQRASITAQLEGDPLFFDARIAGWWVWGICAWIGSGWCSGDGPWQVDDGRLVQLGNAGQGVHRQLVHLRGAGQGVHRKLVHLGGAGQGVHRKLVHLGGAGRGVHRTRGDGLLEWFEALQDRLRDVRVCCGDWERICGLTPTVKHGMTGVFLDPPYPDTAGRSEVYAVECDQVAHRVRDWALAQGDDPLLRIVLCGYEGQHQMPASWAVVEWKAQGGYGSRGDGQGRVNAARERLWCSPHCVPSDEPIQQHLTL